MKTSIRVAALSAILLAMALTACADMSFERTGLVQSVEPGKYVAGTSIRARRDVKLEADATLSAGSIEIVVFADGVAQGESLVIAAPGASITKSWPKAPGPWHFEVLASMDAAGGFDIHITDR